MAAPKKATTPKQNGNSTTNRPVAVMPKSSASAQTGNNVEELVRRRAYEIYESTGRPDGRAEEHWLQAEAELRERTA